MKKPVALFLVTFISTVAFAKTPKVLRDLVPVGAKELRLKGKSADHQPCQVVIANEMGFSASLAIYKNGKMDTRRFGKFQIGLGHELQSLDEDGAIIAVSVKKADEQYSSNRRSTLTAARDGDGLMFAIGIKEEAKGWFGYSTEVDELCTLE
jgi:hypothetical protein